MKASSIIQTCKLAQQDDLVRPFLAKFYLKHSNFSSVMDQCHLDKNFVQKVDDFPPIISHTLFFKLLDGLK